MNMTVMRYLLSLGGNGVDFINEDDGRRVLLRLLERLSQVALGFTSHLRHDLRTVDEEEERASFVRNSSCHEGLTRTGRTEHEDTTRRLDTDRLEELGMPQGQLDELTDLRHLLAAATNVVIANIGEVRLFVFTLDRVTLCGM